MNKKLGFISLFITSVLFSTYGIFSRFLSKQLTVFQQLSFRYSIGIVMILVIIFFIKKQSFHIKKFFNLKIGFFALLIPISFYFFIKAFLESKLSVSISGFYAGTILSSLFIGYFFLKEKITHNGLMGFIFIVFAFILLNNLNLQEITNIGLIWGLISGVAYGMANFIKKNSGKFSKEEVLLILSTSTAVFMQILSFVNKEALPVQISSITLINLFLFVAVALSAEYLTILGFRNFDLYLGSIILSLEIVFTIFVGIIFFKEFPTNFELIGILFIIISVVLTNLPVKTTMKYRVKS
ncbi:hypothetical protein A2334_01490 [Candidatus Roizmanbacteria bacterium RIFOXYB2_FULL_38_10]|uniref:EamA domain-containing protein n=1 Tax=Candidatus Roizmanbacteria bacterium RIFOXYD1_FULL_38_12 TaxID=1802093 RepID=A0A1F7L244_9BACT|nr:MAG: hypothetical protein A3K47_05570 [Candidatus Roizmanbacteria bacterium RIFOXYA2_FULL_38_14]OGK64212.1 MAG: hypothetical protein A3K27_05570 [Candidatus Roizmanbacteria bacterium RIFOXYA1_FULL_37_12]OGK66058.1 MAG: hypothetical protein A3K38_05570 [Candidatus Roizmanbacteria bacterium RIFOXYB1_FULL_40_23]OGK68523.1 MAG: hypothetical protein A2334_01490 [Candidatus Roizmanbacteria bacterium RIFOXYB2_FULL_38_10]OGK70463.1 MAG: hypothetical protein A3K21_05575 [Candidatus Roizmanbacteria ba